MSPHSQDDAQSAHIYHPVRPLPFNILNTILIDLDERLFPSAFGALSTLLHSGVSHRSDYALFLPPSQYLALAATLIVHPATTTGTDSTVPTLAATYLRDIIALAGPGRAGLREAWEFSKTAARARRGNEDEEDDDTTKIKLRMANDGSLFRHAEDLWAVVGWAFNTSVLYPTRWAHWKVFLDVLLEALEVDWTQIQEQTKAVSSENFQQSLLVAFLPDAHTRGMAAKRRIIRSIFADGSDQAAKEFVPVWNKELARKKQTKDFTKKKVDVYNDEYADYLDDDADADFDFSVPQDGLDWDPGSQPDSSAAPSGPNSMAALGGIETMVLRQRFLSLLSSVCYSSPTSFMSVSDLYEDLTTHVRPLPCDLFVHMSLSTRVLPAGDGYRVEFMRALATTVIQPAAPDSRGEPISQEIMIECFLPFAANIASAVENAKLGIVLSGMLSVLLNRGLLQYSKSLETAARKGVESRDEKGRKGSPDEIRSLHESSMRVRAIIKGLKRKS